MKVKKISNARKQTQPTPEVAQVMHTLMEVKEDDLPRVIVQLLTEWSLGKSDLHNWAPVLDRFDDILKRLAGEYIPQGPQQKEYTALDKKLIMCMLSLEKLLLENSSSRNLFNTYDRLNELLMTNDMEILECTLELLVLPARKLEAHRHLLKTYNEQIKLARLKLFAGVLLPEEMDEDLKALAKMHEGQREHGKLLHIRLVSLYILLMLDFHTHDASESVVFSVNPLLIEEISKLVTCIPVAPMKIEAAAMFVMRACLKFEFKAQEISNSLNLSAGHGIVLNLIRTMNAVFCSPNSAPYSLYFITGFTDLLYRLCSSPDYDAELLNAGIMEELVKTIEHCHPLHYRHVEKYVYSLDSMISKLLGTMDAFMAVDGLNALVRTIGKYSVAPCPAAPYLAALFRLLEKILMCHGSDERLRNVVETPLFSSHVKFILENAQLMGPEVLNKAACVMATFIHNEPNTLAILQECGVTQAFLTSLNDFGLPVNSEFISKIFTALSALCLNSNGTNTVKAANPFSMIFSIFLDRQYSRSLLSQTNCAVFGQSVDEFMRHHPLLKEVVMDEMLAMLQKLPDAMLAVSNEEPRLNSFQPVGPSVEVKKIEAGEKWEMEEAPSALLFEAACMMLETILANPIHFADFEKRGVIPVIVKCMVNGSLPYDFVSSASSHSLAHLFQVVSEMEDNKLLEALSSCVDFEVDFSRPLISDIVCVGDLTEANRVLNKLVAVSNVLDFLCEVYISSAHGHLRTIGAMANFLKNTEDAQLFFSKLIKLAMDCRIQWMDMEKLPVEWLRTVLNFEGKETERPIDLLLSPKYASEIGFVDMKDPRIINLRMASSVIRELIDSVVAVFASFAKATNGRRLTEYMQDPKVLKLMRNVQVNLMEEALKISDDITFMNFSCLGMFLLDNVMFEDVTSKVHLMTTCLIAFTEKFEGCETTGLEVFKATVLRVMATPKSDMGLATFTSIAVSFMDHRSYGMQFSEEFYVGPLKRLQSVYETICQCCYVIVQNPQLIENVTEDSLVNLSMLLALIICPEVDTQPADITKFEFVEYFNFRRALLIEASASSEFVKKEDVKYTAIFKKNPNLLLAFVLKVYGREGGLRCLKYVAACVATFFEHVNEECFVGMSKARVYRLLAAVTVLSEKASRTMWPVIKGGYKEEKEEESVICLLLIVSQIMPFIPNEEYPEIWGHLKSLWSLIDNPDFVHAMLQCILAFSVYSGVMWDEEIYHTLKYLFSCFPVAVKSTKPAHEAIVNLIPLIIRANIERFGSYRTVLVADEIHDKAGLVRTEFISFNEFMNERFQPMCKLYPDDVVEGMKRLFKLSIARSGSFETVEELRQHLKSNMKLSLGKRYVEDHYDIFEPRLAEWIVCIIFKELLEMKSGECFTRSGLVMLLSELTASYRWVYSDMATHEDLGKVIDYMLRNMTAAVDQDFALQQHQTQMTEHAEKIKMESVIERAWCQYFIHCLFSTGGELHYIEGYCKALATGLTSALKACQGEEPERAIRWLYGLADMVYHLLTMRIPDENDRKLVISKMVAHLVENKVIVLFSMVLRSCKNASPKLKEMTEGKVIRTVELLTRYGNRLRKVSNTHGATSEMMLHGDEVEDEDDFGYESFDEEEDNPVEEEAEMLAEAEDGEDAMHSEEMMDVDEIHSMTSDDDSSHMDMDDDDEEDTEDSEEDDSDGAGNDSDTEFEMDDEDDDVIMDEEEDFMDDGTLEITYDDDGDAHYQLRPEDIDFHAGQGRRVSVQRFLNRMMDNAASTLRENEEEEDYVTVADENPETLPHTHLSEEDEGDDDGQMEEEEGEEENGDGEFEFEFEARFPPLTRGTGGFVNRSRRFGGDNAIQLLDRGSSIYDTYASVALNGPSQMTLPLHSYFEEKVNAKISALNTMCTPISSQTAKRWAQVSNLFKNLPANFEEVKKQVLEYFIEQAVANFKPPLKEEKKEDKVKVQVEEEEEESSEYETEAEEENSVGEEEIDVVGEGGEATVFEDDGVDVSFLEALPFDMRQEVLEQHFEERRHRIPEGATVRISQSFLDSLPEDLRADYVRMSEEDVRRNNVLRGRGFGGVLGGRNMLLNNLDLQQLLSSLDPVLRQALGAPPVTGSARPLLAVRSTNTNLPPPAANAATAPTPSTEQQQQPAPGASATAVEESPAMVDPHSIVTLLGCFYEPLVLKDKRTVFKMMLHLCSNAKTRNELLNVLLLVLEEAPQDLNALDVVFDGYLQAKAKTTATPRKVTSPLPPRPASVIGLESASSSSNGEGRMSLKQIVIVQRTLQLLMYLVTHEKTVMNFFIVESDHLLTRQSSLQNLIGKKPSGRKLLPIVLLLTCLESPAICGQSMLVEYMLHLIALVTGKFKEGGVSGVNIPLNHLHALVRTLQVCEFTYKASIYANQSFSNFSALPNVASTLISDLKEQSDRLLDLVTKDLQELCAVVEEEPLMMEKIKELSASTSSQNRLLRVYKILNSMSSENESELKLSESFRAFSEVLSQFLGKFEDRMNLATGLLPIIESFFLHYKLSRGVNEGFAEKHRKVINALIRTTPTLLLGSMNRLALDCPHVLEFDNKRIYFKSQLHKRTPEREQHSHTLTLNVRRSHVFEDSFQQVMSKAGEDFRYGRLNVKFYGEDGVDAGGVTREWFSVLSLQMFNADYALFRTSAVDKITYQPNRMSFVNPDHLQYFRFVGRIIAKAINDGRLLDAYFMRSFYKCILGRKIELLDLEAVDPDFYKSLLWVLNNDITDVVEQTFSVEVDDFGVKNTVDLVPNGRNIMVTEANKQEYVQRVAEHRLVDQINPQIDAFLSGFREVIPPNLISIFDEQELELLISGLPEIDVDDWKNNTEYQGYTLASAQIQWFWRCVRAMSLEERAKVIQFVTGTSKVPLEGFAHLQGSSGRQRFQIHRDFGAKDRLPSAHTCFNQLDLPEYDSYEALRDALKKVIGEFGTGFGLA